MQTNKIKHRSTIAHQTVNIKPPRLEVSWWLNFSDLNTFCESIISHSSSKSTGSYCYYTQGVFTSSG